MKLLMHFLLRHLLLANKDFFVKEVNGGGRGFKPWGDIVRIGLFKQCFLIG